MARGGPQLAVARVGEGQDAYVGDGNIEVGEFGKGLNFAVPFPGFHFAERFFFEFELQVQLPEQVTGFAPEVLPEINDPVNSGLSAPAVIKYWRESFRVDLYLLHGHVGSQFLVHEYVFEDKLVNNRDGTRQFFIAHETFVTSIQNGEIGGDREEHGQYDAYERYLNDRGRVAEFV